MRVRAAWFHFVISALVFSATCGWAEDRTVIIPLWHQEHYSATSGDVLDGKTFTNNHGSATGLRPLTPIATDHIGPGIQPPQPRFEVLRLPFVVTPQAGYGARDRLTGLVWRLAPESAKKTFAEASDFCEDLETRYQLSFASRPIGVSDWRLPTIREMESLLDYSRAGITLSGSNALAIPNFFTGVQNGEYWTATRTYWVTCNSYPFCQLDYVVDIVQATTRQETFDPRADNPKHYLWCVRGPYGIPY